MVEEPEDLTDYSEDGVDLTLIRWFLSLTPAERLDYVQRRANDIVAVRRLKGDRVISCPPYVCSGRVASSSSSSVDSPPHCMALPRTASTSTLFQREMKRTWPGSYAS